MKKLFLLLFVPLIFFSCGQTKQKHYSYSFGLSNPQAFSLRDGSEDLGEVVIDDNYYEMELFDVTPIEFFAYTTEDVEKIEMSIIRREDYKYREKPYNLEIHEDFTFGFALLTNINHKINFRDSLYRSIDDKEWPQDHPSYRGPSKWKTDMEEYEEPNNFNREVLWGLYNKKCGGFGFPHDYTGDDWIGKNAVILNKGLVKLNEKRGNDSLFFKIKSMLKTSINFEEFLNTHPWAAEEEQLSTTYFLENHFDSIALNSGLELIYSDGLKLSMGQVNEFICDKRYGGYYICKNALTHIPNYKCTPPPPKTSRSFSNNKDCPDCSTNPYDYDVSLGDHFEAAKICRDMKMLAGCL